MVKWSKASRKIVSNTFLAFFSIIKKERQIFSSICKMTLFCKRFVPLKNVQKREIWSILTHHVTFLGIHTFQKKSFKNWKPCYLLFFKKQPTMKRIVWNAWIWRKIFDWMWKPLKLWYFCKNFGRRKKAEKKQRF